MKRIFLPIILISFYSCKDKPKFFGVNKICNGLYREKYRVSSGGALSAELYEDYLTDSTNFRFYVGKHDEQDNFDYQCLGDTIIVRKFRWEEGHTSSTILSKNVFSLKTLKQLHKLRDIVAN